MGVGQDFAAMVPVRPTSRPAASPWLRGSPDLGSGLCDVRASVLGCLVRCGAGRRPAGRGLHRDAGAPRGRCVVRLADRTGPAPAGRYSGSRPGGGPRAGRAPGSGVRLGPVRRPGLRHRARRWPDRVRAVLRLGGDRPPPCLVGHQEHHQHAGRHRDRPREDPRGRRDPGPAAARPCRTHDARRGRDHPGTAADHDRRPRAGPSRDRRRRGLHPEEAGLRSGQRLPLHQQQRPPRRGDPRRSHRHAAAGVRPRHAVRPTRHPDPPGRPADVHRLDRPDRPLGLRVVRRRPGHQPRGPRHLTARPGHGQDRPALPRPRSLAGTSRSSPPTG